MKLNVEIANKRGIDKGTVKMSLCVMLACSQDIRREMKYALLHKKALEKG